MRPAFAGRGPSWTVPSAYVYAAVAVADVPASATTTSTVPATCAVVMQVIFVEETTVTGAQAAPPSTTVVPDVNPVPVMLTVVPPETGPALGVIAPIESATTAGVFVGGTTGAASITTVTV